MKNSYRFSLVQLCCLCLLFAGNVLLAQGPILPPPPSVGSNANKQSIPNLLAIHNNSITLENHQSEITPIEIVNETIWDGTTWSNGSPDAFTRAVINANYVATDILDVYDISIRDGVTLTLDEGVLLKSKQFLSKEIKDKIIMQENSGTLSKLPNTTLSVFVRENGKVNQYSSMFMSSPVIGQAIGDTFTDITGSPNVGHAYRQYNGAGFIPETFPMSAGSGYIETTEGNQVYDAAIPIAPYNHTYTGTENTNNSYPISVINGYNLVGNPYASSLDSDSFLLDPSNTAASCIFLWTRNTLASSLVAGDDVYNFSTLDYAMYNVLGGINAGRNITLNSRAPIGTTLVPFSYRENYDIPDGKIHFGTSFYLRTSSAGTVTFKNNMTTSPTGQIFRHSSNRLTNAALITPPTRSRIWINLAEGNSHNQSTGRYRQTLIGYATGATTGGTDRLFDAEPLNHFTYVPLIDVYSFAPSSATKLAIQGRDNFQNTDSFQLGYKVTNVGWANSTQNFTFSATHDGLFNTKPYYILDAVDGQYHTLPYTFNTAAGTFENRFKVVFENLTQISSPAVCGTTITSIWTTLFSTQISGATVYKYEVKDVSGNLVGVYNGNIPPFFRPYQFYLNIASQISYDSTYTIRVATYQINDNGVLSWAYGPSCTITTPSPPTSKLTDTVGTSIGSCNSVINNFNNSLYCYSPAELGFSTSGYRFQVSTSSTFAPATIVGLVEKTTNGFTLAQLRPTYQPLPSTVYYVRIQIRYNNSGTPTWQVDGGMNPIYGPVCTVTTTATATGRFTSSDLSIFETKAYPNPFANNFKLEINTSSEELIELKVFDMIGRQIESRLVSISDINTQGIGENYTSGVYNVVIKQGDNIKTLRMIKR